MSESNTISKWVALLWSQAQLSWISRRQDYNYRHYLARPGISKLLRQLGLPQEPILFDLGCAEGRETEYLHKKLLQFGYQPKVYGFDPYFQQSMTTESLILDNGEWTKFVGNHKLHSQVDLLTCLFVLQELLSLDQVLKQTEQVLKPRGNAIFLTVHPDFGLALLEKGALRVNRTLAKKISADWQFAAAYPIVEEDGKNFFLPYFHRSLEDYKKIIGQRLLIQGLKGLQPSKKQLHFCQQKKISPFYNHLGNVYWPEIAEQASSLLIIASKKGGN